MKKHILLIEDEKEKLSVFVKALNEIQLPYKCTYAEDYKHALQMLEYLVPDYIFIDGLIPGMSCLDCLRSIREKISLRSSSLVLYDITKELAEKAASAGVDYCIDKPSAVEELTAILSHILLPVSRQTKDPGVKTPG